MISTDLQSVQHLANLVDLIRQMLESQKALQKYQQSQIPKYLAREYGVISNDVTLLVPAQSHNLEHISSVLLYASSGPVTVTLGRRTFILPAGFTPLTHIDMVLFNGDVRMMTQPVAGPMYMELMGEELPPDGQGGLF